MMNFNSSQDKTLAKISKPIQRVLLISFDRFVKAVCEFHLREMGFDHIDDVVSAEEALAMGLEHYALIVCDDYLGDGISGIALLRSMTYRRYQPIPFLLLTEDPYEPKIQRALISGRLKQVVVKPISDRIFPRAVKCLLGENNLPDPTQGYLSKQKTRRKPKKDIVRIMPEIKSEAHPYVPHPDGLNQWQELIFDLVEGAKYSYSKIAYRLELTPSTIQKLATQSHRKPRLRVFHQLMVLYFKVFTGPFATKNAKAYYEKKPLGSFGRPYVGISVK